MIPLRPYQSEGVARVRARIASGKRRLLFVLPTGGGKTVVASSIVEGAVSKGKRVLFCAHRRELIKQTATKLFRMGLPAESIGVVMAGIPARARGSLFGGPLDVIARLRAQGLSDLQTDAELWTLFGARRPQALVQVASIDTARGRDLVPPDLLIFDEAHRSLSPSYRALADKYSSAILLGLTATPYRTDGKGLGALFDDLVPPVMTARELAAAGYLVAPRMYGAPLEALPDLSDVKSSGDDFDADQLSAAMAEPRIITGAVKQWGALAQGLRTVLFAASIPRSKEAVDAFRAAGVRAEHLDGTMRAEDRDAILARLERGETTLVSNYGVLTEGWDCPPVAVALLLRPTESRALAKQMMGRILRPHAEKPFAMLLDHALVVMNHDGPLAEEDYSLEAPKKKRSAPSVAIKTCPGCFALVPATVRTCPEKKTDGTPCLFVFSDPGGGGPEESEAALVPLVDVPMEAKRAFWAELCEQRGRRKPGWVHVEYLKRFGTKAPKHWRVPLHEHEKPENNAEHMQTWREIYMRAAEHGDPPSAAKGRFRFRLNFWPSGAMLDEQREYLARRTAAAETEVCGVEIAAPPPEAPSAVPEAPAPRRAASPARRWVLPTQLPSFAEVAA